MCAPKNQLIKTALIGAAIYATGGAAAGSLLTTSGGSMAAASTAATTGSTLSTLATAAKYALPVISAGGNILQGYMQSQILAQKANFVNFEIATEKSAFSLRKVQKRREMIEAIGKQRALFGITGTSIEGSPSDVLGLTASNFAENVYIDAFNTSQKILGKEQQKDILNQESRNSIIGGYTAAATTLGTRGFSDLITTTTTGVNTGPTSDISKLSRVRTATEGSN